MLYNLMLLIPAILWGTLGIFVRNIDLPTMQTVFYRTVLASISLVIIFYLSKKKLDKKALKSQFFKLMVAGIAIGFNWVALFEAYKQTSVGVATVVYYLAPAMVIAASPFCYKERLTANKILGLLAAILGMMLVSFSAGVGDVSLAGIALAFGGAVLYAGITLVNKSIKGMDGFQVSMVELLCAVPVLFLYTALFTTDGWIMPDTTSLINLVIVGAFHTGICYGLYFSAVQKVPAQTAAMYSFADPFTALLVSVTVLGEAMTWMQVGGAVCILGGAMVAELYRGKRGAST
ncbi:MAG: DMT family transporter [Eubacteriales bacterium]